MRIWSLSPKYLDQKGLGGLWSEALQCQDVILGITNMHKNHPQTHRWIKEKDPLRSLSTYLLMLHNWVSENTKYNYNRDLIVYKKPGFVRQMFVTSGQLKYEADCLVQKLKERHGQCLQKTQLEHDIYFKKIVPHPLFTVIDGAIEPWEKIKKK